MILVGLRPRHREPPAFYLCRCYIFEFYVGGLLVKKPFPGKLPMSLLLFLKRVPSKSSRDASPSFITNDDFH